MMQILGICGSLRAASTNSRLLSAALQLAPPDVEMSLTSSVTNLPLFNPDHDPDAIDPVRIWAEEVRLADGIIISTPEYARGYPGALKNALDWLVGTDAWIDKPFMFLNASGRSTVGRDSLMVVLDTMSGVHIEAASTIVPLLGKTLSASDVVADARFAGQIRTSLQAFAAGIKAHQSAGLR